MTNASREERTKDSCTWRLGKLNRTDGLVPFRRYTSFAKIHHSTSLNALPVTVVEFPAKAAPRGRPWGWDEEGRKMIASVHPYTHLFTYLHPESLISEIFLTTMYTHRNSAFCSVLEVLNQAIF